MIRRALGLTVLAILLPLGGLPAQDGPPDPPRVEVTAKDFEFQMPEEIRSGWTQFRFVNAGEQEHFFLLWKLPPGKTFRNYQQEVAHTFEDVWQRYSSGELNRKETMKALAAELPAWFMKQAKPASGAALTEPGDTSRVTLELEPGTYAMECYVKTPQGTFHSSRGMLREVTVTEESTRASPPEPDAEVTLSNYEISTSGELTAGRQTVAVHIEDNPDGMLMHDANLIRLEEGDTAEDLVTWMDWMERGQFRNPAPGYSLGGVEHMTAGNTGYLTVDLEPGRYAWVSEWYADRGMVKTFTVE